MRHRRIALLLAGWSLVAAACGGYEVLVEEQSQSGAVPVVGPTGPAVVQGGGGGGGGGGTGAGGDVVQTGGGGGGDEAAGGGTRRGPRCATNSNPAQGFTESEIKIGTILPLVGALRPIGEQVARVMKVMSEEWLPNNDYIEGPLKHLNWDCPSRPGVFGRTYDLKIFSLQANTPEEALGGMRRLIDAEKVFMVRDCYLTDSLMGPATSYQNSKGVPGIWCHFGGMPTPALAKWNFNPGIDALTQAAIHTGYLFKELGKQRLAVLADSNDQVLVETVKRVAAHFGHPIPEECIVTSKTQDAPNGMSTQVAQIRSCYVGGPDAVFAGDGLQAVFGALEAERQGWRPASAGVQWVCTNPSCWAVALAEICGDACEGMITDCASLPCIPWADPNKYPAVRTLENARRQYLPGEPPDAATYGPMAITNGITYWLTMTGPDLSREKFRQTVEGLRNWSSGIGPVINTSPSNHYGGQAQWLVRYTGRAPWFDDQSGDFVTLDDVGVPSSIVYG